MDADEAHAMFTNTCVRYITFGIKNSPHYTPDTGNYWELYTQYIETKPFAAYALSHLHEHMTASCNSIQFRVSMSELIKELVQTPTWHLLEAWSVSLFRNWIDSIFKHQLFSESLPAISELKNYLYELRSGLMDTSESFPTDIKEIVLKFALYSKSPNALEIALSAGAYVEQRLSNSFPWTPLMYSSWNGDTDMVRILATKFSADLLSVTNDGHTALHLAAQNGQEGVVCLLVSLGADIEAKDCEDKTPLHLAAEYGHEEVARTLSKNLPADSQSQDCNQQTPLHIAVENGHIGIVRVIIYDSKVNKDASDVWSRTALHLAAARGHSKIIQILSPQPGVDTEVVESNGMTPLHLAAENGHAGVVYELVTNFRAKKEAVDSQKRTPLHMAVWEGHEAVVNTLVNDLGAKFQAVHYSALHLAAYRGHEEIARILVAAGADIYSEFGRLRTPLYLAVRNGHDALVRLFITEYNVDLNIPDSDGGTLLHLAVNEDNTATAGLLIELGSDIEAKDENDLTAFYMAVVGGKESAARLLRKYGADIETKNKYGLSALHIAAQRGCVKTIRFLAELGADLEVVDTSGQTALHHAIIEPKDTSLGALNSLIELGASVESRDLLGRTALHVVCRDIYESKFTHRFIELLAGKGAVLNAKDYSGQTPMCTALAHCKKKVVHSLKESGAKVVDTGIDLGKHFAIAAAFGFRSSIKLLLSLQDEIDIDDILDHEQKSLLHIAAENDQAEIVELLLIEAFESNLQLPVLFDCHGKTSLHLAAQKGYDKIVDSLLEIFKSNDSDNFSDYLEVKDQDGRTALHLAAKGGHLAITENLVEYEANIQAQDFAGRTPIHLAAANGYLYVTMLLHKYWGKNSTCALMDKNGKTPCDLATEAQYTEIIEYFTHGVDPITATTFSQLHIFEDYYL